MDKIKTQQELLEENESLKSKVVSLQKSNFELKEYAKLIEESEEQFKAFANQTTEGITVADLEGNYVYVNPGFCKMSGYTEEELLDLTVFDMKSKEESRERFAESKSIKEGVSMFVQLQKKDKTNYFTEIIGNVITVGDEKLVLGTVRDITERTFSEQKLKQSKIELIEAQRIGNLGNWKLDFISKKLTWSNQVYEIFGVKPTYKLTYKTIYDFVHQDDKELLDSVFDESIKEKKEYYLEFRIVLNDASIRWVLEQGECVYDSSENVIGVIGTVQDITDQKLTEEKIKSSEKRYRSIFEATPIALWEEDFSEVKVLLDTLKKKGLKHFKKYFDEHPVFVQKCADAVIIIDVNHEAVLLHEALSKKDLLNNLSDFFLPESFEAFKKELVALAKGKNSCELETVVKTKSGGKKYVHLKFVVAPGFEADFKKVYIAIQDVSNLKKTQLSLAKNKDKLNEVLSIAKLGSFVFDDSTGLFESSLIADEILGIDKLYKRDIEGWANLIHPEDFIRVQQFVDDIGIESGTIEFRVIHPVDKKIIWLFANIRKEHDKSGVRTKITGTFRDSTERKKILKTLEDSENMLIESQQVAKIGSYILNFSLGIWKSSLELDMIFGIKSGIRKGVVSWLDVIHPDDKDMVGEYLETNVMLNHEFFNKEYRIINKKTKKTHWVQGMGALEFDDKGSLLTMKGTIQDITVRKINENKIKFLSEITQQSKTAVLTANLDFEITWVNESFTKLYGYKFEEVVGKSPAILSADFLAEEIQNEIYNAILTNQKYKIESLDKKKDGTVFPVEIEVLPILDKKGNISAYSSHIVDITERKNKEEELIASKKEAQENETRFKALYNASFGGITIHDKGVILDCNQGLSEMTGYSLDELIGMDGLLLIEESFRNSVMDKILAGYEKPYEVVGIHKNKEVYPLRLMGKTIPYRGKEVRSVEFRDITEQKKAEEKLKESEERFRGVVTLAPNPIMIHDEDGKVLQLSKGWTTYSGYTINDIPTISDWTKKAYGKEDEYTKGYINNLFKINKTKNNGEWNVKTTSGEMRVWEFYTTPIGKDNEGKRIISSMAFDVTDRNKGKKELDVYRETLEELVKERTKELEAKNCELDNAMKVFVGREMKIRELYKKIKKLEEQ